MSLNTAIDAAFFSLSGKMFIERICLLLLKALIDRFSIPNQQACLDLNTYLVDMKRYI